jgi:hypothetical protein
MSTLPVLLRPDAALIVGKSGHTVLDDIQERGFTVIVSRQISRPLTITASLRAGNSLTIDITPVCEGEVLSGLDVSLSGCNAAFDVVVIGDGMGLDDEEQRLTGSSDDKRSCQMRW